MKIHTTDTDDLYEVVLYFFDGSHVGCDLLCDMETTFPNKYPKEPGSNYILCPQSAFDDLIKWWSDEVEDANDGFLTEVLDSMTEECKEKGCRYNLIVREEN